MILTSISQTHAASTSVCVDPAIPAGANPELVGWSDQESGIPRGGIPYPSWSSMRLLEGAASIVPPAKAPDNPDRIQPTMLASAYTTYEGITRSAPTAPRNLWQSNRHQ